MPVIDYCVRKLRVWAAEPQLRRCAAAAQMARVVATQLACAAGHIRLSPQSDWRVVQRGYYAHVLGEAPHHFKDPVEAVRTLKKDNSVSGAVCGNWVGSARWSWVVVSKATSDY